MTAAVLTRLSLTDFRSYERADLGLDGRPVWLAGPNGAGKTNLLEAVSFLIPGRGLRGSALGEVGRRMPGEAAGRAWAVAVTLRAEDGETRLGTGVEQAGAARRVVRVEGEAVPPGRLAERPGDGRRRGRDRLGPGVGHHRGRGGVPGVGQHQHLGPLVQLVEQFGFGGLAQWNPLSV